MGEAKRRRVQQMELVTLTAGQLHSMGAICAWDGCETTYEQTSDGQPPKGWNILYTLKAYRGGLLPNGEPAMSLFHPGSGLQRDAVLCPHHARILEGQLKSLGRELLDPDHGNA